MTILYRLAVVIGMAAIVVAGMVFSAKAAPVPTGVAAVSSSVAWGATSVHTSGPRRNSLDSAAIASTPASV